MIIDAVMRSYSRYFFRISVFLSVACLILAPVALPFQVTQGKVTLALSFQLPKGYAFTEEAPFRIEWAVDNPAVIQFEKTDSKGFTPVSLYKIPVQARPGNAIVSLRATLYYCDKVTGMCFRDVFKTSVPLEVSPAGSSTVLYTWHIKPRPRLPNKPTVKPVSQ